MPPPPHTADKLSTCNTKNSGSVTQKPCKVTRCPVPLSRVVTAHMYTVNTHKSSISWMTQNTAAGSWLCNAVSIVLIRMGYLHNNQVHSWNWTWIVFNLARQQNSTISSRDDSHVNLFNSTDVSGADSVPIIRVMVPDDGYGGGQLIWIWRGCHRETIFLNVNQHRVLCSPKALYS